jgi:integrase
MARVKTTRNPFGSILVKKITLAGRRVTVYDARKRYTNADGLPDEKFKRCYSQSEAQTALLNFPAEIAEELAGREKEKEKVRSFFDLTNYFRKNYLIKAVMVGDRQIHGYRSNIKTLDNMIKDFEAFFGDRPLESFNYEIVRSYSINLATSPKKRAGAVDPPSQSTVNRKLALLRKIFNVGVQLDWRVTNPMNQGKSLIDTRAERSRTRILTFDEEQRLIAACTGDQFVKYTRAGKEIEANVGPVREHLRPIIITAIDTGMRLGEILAVERGQIDFEAKTLSLRAEQTKGLKRRTMPMSERLERELQSYFKEKFVARTERVFGGVKSVKKAFASACAAAGIEGLHFHDLRHTATTWLDEAGVTEAVKKISSGIQPETFTSGITIYRRIFWQAPNRKLTNFAAEWTRIPRLR